MDWLIKAVTRGDCIAGSRNKLGVAVVAVKRKKITDNYVIPLSLGGVNDLAPDFLLRRGSLTVFGSNEEANDLILITKQHLQKVNQKWQKTHFYRLIPVYAHD